MCGIAGIYQFKNADKAELKEAVGKMNQSQRRRGPDDEGIFIDEKSGVAFGHRRLSILDLSAAGKQPMRYRCQVSGVKCQDLRITFNGEIYNFWELRKNLEEKGYKFKTKTDTEVVLALYAEYGEKSFSMLQGMFAFGLWDAKNQKLFLVKDRYGIKPLYYYGDDEKIIFASTVKAITKSGLIPLRKNPDAYIGFLLFGSVPLPMTTYKEVLAVPAGHYLEINAGGKQKLIQYYEPLEFFQKVNSYSVNELLSKPNNSITNNSITNIRNLLNDAVRSHLISDAPLGVFLSGGLDSSAIAAIARRSFSEGGLPLTTLSIIFDEPEFSEQKYQRLVVQKIKSDHREIKITKQDFFDSFDEIFDAMDQPTIDGINTYFVAKVAKDAGLKAVLSGLGSDEIFMGYHYFRIVKYVRLAQKLMPKFIFNLLPKRGKWGRLQWLKEKHPFYSYVVLRGIFSPKEIAEILKTEENEVWAVVKKILNFLPEEKELKKLSAPNLQSYFDLNFYMANQLLKDTDFMSMHHSIEVRVPFLDHPLVEYVSSLPAEIKINPNLFKNLKFKIKNSRPKPLLISAVQELLPQEVWDRDKMGFTFPFQKWLGEEVNGYSANKLLRKPNNLITNNLITKTHWSRFWAKKVLENYKI